MMTLNLPARATAEEITELITGLRRRGPVIGADEVGRGPLAGPVVGAAVWLTPEQEEKLLALGLRDSKKMTPGRREQVFRAMREMGALWKTHEGSVARIDRDNILQAALWAMGRSTLRLAGTLPAPPACLVVDGTSPIPDLNGLPQWPLVAADAMLSVVSAASVVAKVLRDRLMVALDRRYPGYGLARNKGYPTAAHREAVRQLGPSPVHRLSFCRKILKGA